MSAIREECGTIYQDPPPKLDNSIYDIRLEMWRRGGQFVQDLSRCLGSADLENQAKIVAAFPDILQRYDAFASLTKQEQSDFLNRNADDEE